VKSGAEMEIAAGPQVEVGHPQEIGVDKAAAAVSLFGRGQDS
jgi:hypothetical protein